MNKGLWALSTAMLLAMTSAQAKQKVCVFDLLGKAGESYKMMEEWKLSSKTWQADIDLIAYQDEGKAQQDSYFQQYFFALDHNVSRQTFYLLLSLWYRYFYRVQKYKPNQFVQCQLFLIARHLRC